MIYVIPIFICIILLFAFLKKVNTYKSFTKGAKEGVDLVLSILPFIATIFIAVELFKHSGLLQVFCNVASPIFAVFGIPAELISLIILKPFSGAGSTALLNQIIVEYGANSYLSRVAAVIASSSDTVFYISVIYFSKTKIKRLGMAIPIALFCTFLGAVVASAVCLII